MVVIVVVLMLGLSGSEGKQISEGSNAVQTKTNELKNSIPGAVAGLFYFREDFDNKNISDLQAEGWVITNTVRNVNWQIIGGALQATDTAASDSTFTRQFNVLENKPYTITAKVSGAGVETGLVAGGIYVRRGPAVSCRTYQIKDIDFTTVAVSGCLPFGNNWKITWVPDNGGTLNLDVDGQKINWVTGTNTGLPNNGEFGFRDESQPPDSLLVADNFKLTGG